MLVFNLNIKKKMTKRRDGWMDGWKERDVPRCWVCCVWKVCLHVIIIVIIVKGRRFCDVFHIVLFGVERRYGTLPMVKQSECERSSGQDLHKIVMHIT